MMEDDEFGSNIHLNHCTVLNAAEWLIQSGWIENLSITNSIFVNPYFWGYRAIDVCDEDQTYDDFLAGECESPEGALFSIIPVDSFGFTVNFTDYDRRVYIANNVYVYQDWLLDWYTECPWCVNSGTPDSQFVMHRPLPYVGEKTIAFMDSRNEIGAKLFVKMNIDSATMYFNDPDFIIPATNQDTLKMWMEYGCLDIAIDWSYEPGAGLRQRWPLPENLAYSNSYYQTAAMGGFPLGDLNWFPDQLPAWEAQRDYEWHYINMLLNYYPWYTNLKTESGNIPDKYVLQQNYPNPFNPETSISFSIPKYSNVSLAIYNSAGQKVVSLISNEKKSPGNYSIVFDGSGLPSGAYYARLEAGDYISAVKLLLIK